MRMAIGMAVLFLALAGALADGVGAPPSAAAGAAHGRISVLTYNVAGLPEGLSSSRPATYTPLISPLLNTYDLVLVQEDFWYHRELAASDRHPFASTPAKPVTRPMPDGLNVFADAPLGAIERVEWRTCSGVFGGENDCLAEKGFTVATLELAPGVEVDVYDLHADAGGAVADVAARADQFAQLADFIAQRSADRALIVAGDTNLSGRSAGDRRILGTFLADTSLVDSGAALGRADGRIDRVMVRGSRHVTLRPVEWRIAQEFVGPGGVDLSDHKAVNVILEWAARRRF